MRGDWSYVRFYGYVGVAVKGVYTIFSLYTGTPTPSPTPRPTATRFAQPFAWCAWPRGRRSPRPRRGGGGGARLQYTTGGDSRKWKKALLVLESMLGVHDLDVTRGAPGEILFWLPRETRAMTSFVPGPDELTHIAHAPDEDSARAAAVAAHSSFRWVLGRTSEGEVLGERIARAPHALVAGAIDTTTPSYNMNLRPSDLGSEFIANRLAQFV